MASSPPSVSLDPFASIARCLVHSLAHVNVSRKLHTRPAQRKLRHAVTSPQSGGWQFAIPSTIGRSKTTKVAHPVPPCDLRDACRVRISDPQGAVHLLHAV